MYKNRITIIGNVSQEPTVRTTGSGVEVCNFSVATNHFFYRGEEKISQPEYHNCSAWDRLVPRCEHLKLGQKIEIEGRVKENNWEKTCSCGQTIKQYRYEIQVSSILYLEKKDENA